MTIQLATEQRAVVPFLDSTGLLSSPEQLRERAHQDGYVFVRDLVNHDAILRLRRDVTSILKNVG